MIENKNQLSLDELDQVSGGREIEPGGNNDTDVKRDWCPECGRYTEYKEISAGRRKCLNPDCGCVYEYSLASMGSKGGIA